MSSQRLAIFCSLLLVFELAAAAFGPYGYYIDEPYYLACAHRLAWGYVDHPPLSLVILRATTALFGQSKLALCLPAALAGAATAFMTGSIARRLGGGRFAQLIAAACPMVGPGYLIVFGFFSMNAFEVLAWTSVAYLLIIAIDAQVRGDGTREFVLLGGVLGAAALNKHTSVLYFGALGIALLLSSARGVLRTKGPWLALGLALLMLVPNLLWQGAHDFISVEFYRTQASRNVDTPVLLGLLNQVLFINPAALPLCVMGLWFFLMGAEGACYRVFGLSFLLLLGCLLALHSSRPDRIAGAYPVLFAAGAVVFERLTRDRKRSLRFALVTILLVGGAGLVPLALPILPPVLAARYAQTLGVVPRIERQAAALPEWLAERLGWPELVAAVADVAHRLTPEERRHVIVLAPSYDVAAAIELFGPAQGLERVVSPHNSYYLWGEQLLAHESPQPDDVVIAVGIPEPILNRHFRQVTRAGHHRCDICLQGAPDLSLLVARDPSSPLSKLFTALRRIK